MKGHISTVPTAEVAVVTAAEVTLTLETLASAAARFAVAEFICKAGLVAGAL